LLLLVPAFVLLVSCLCVPLRVLGRCSHVHRVF
jgi:hypothetical protein